MGFRKNIMKKRMTLQNNSQKQKKSERKEIYIGKSKSECKQLNMVEYLEKDEYLFNLFYSFKMKSEKMLEEFDFKIIDDLKLDGILSD